MVDFRDRPALLPAEVMAHVYEALLDEIRTQGFRVLVIATVSLPRAPQARPGPAGLAYRHGLGH